jgi:hypothetical protein
MLYSWNVDFLAYINSIKGFQCAISILAYNVLWSNSPQHFFFLIGTSDSLVSGSTSIDNVNMLNPDGQTELQILLNTGEGRSQTMLHFYITFFKNALKFMALIT